MVLSRDHFGPRRHWSRVVALVVLCVVSLVAAQARADGEVWIWHERRVLLAEASPATPKLELRLMTDTRFNARSEGLDMAFMRVGPVVHLAPWFFAAAHATAIADRLPTGAFGQQYRAEFDLNPHGKFGEFIVADRTRTELVIPVGQPAFFRVRTMPRVTWRPNNGAWLPFMADEIFFAPRARPVFPENRLFLGIGRLLAPATRLDVAYMLRSRRGNDEWIQDHAALVSLFFGAPTGALAPVPLSSDH